MAKNNKSGGGCLLILLAYVIIGLTAEFAFTLIFGVGWITGKTEVIEGDLYRHESIEFDGFSLIVKSRVIAHPSFVTPGLDQPSLDAEGNIVSENIGQKALNRALEMHNVRNVRCRKIKGKNGDFWSCRSKKLRGGLFEADENIHPLRHRLPYEGLAWETFPYFQKKACDEGLGLWAGGPYQIPPDVWRSRDPNIHIKDLPRKHCYEGIEEITVRVISEEVVE
ncbi:MAG: hypothetical protein Alpg2KO_29160 [Alphaproteobacteria bacterium]